MKKIQKNHSVSNDVLYPQIQNYPDLEGHFPRFSQLKSLL